MGIARCVALTAALLGIATISQPASAATVSCPGTASIWDREFQVTVASGDAVCLAAGTHDQVMNETFLAANPDWTFVDRDKGNDMPDFGFSYTGDGTLSGTFTLTPETGFKYALGLKSKAGQLDPDWAIFELPIGTTVGEWEIVTGYKTLEHATLYRMAVSEVPLPASLPLLLGGLAGLGVLGRRRREAL